MAGEQYESELHREMMELETILQNHVKTPGLFRELDELLQQKKKLLTQQDQQEEQVQQVTLPFPEPVKVAVHKLSEKEMEKHQEEFSSFSEIARFGWEDDGYGKEKVNVYIMSGIDGVGNLPKEKIVCDFTKSSFDFKIFNLDGKNFRLFKDNLEKEIDPTKSFLRIKKNRVTICLYKKEKNETWMNLTAKNPHGHSTTKKNKSDEDPMGGIMDLMKNMYEEGDDEMKRTIAKAWTESRQKQQQSSTTNDMF
jgi:calcyclin binding protein